MAKPLSWLKYKPQLLALSMLGFNYDEEAYRAASEGSRWYLDHHHASLTTESAGQPVPLGPFESAQTALAAYEFADPRLIQVVFDPTSELLGRNILMFAKFLGFTFNFGVRVTNVIDETKSNALGELVKTWGYSYRTLQGHFEIGEITFLLSKNIATGEVTVDINAHSKRERIPNIFYRTGFRVFSRPLQKYFAYSATAHLKRIAEQAKK